MPSDAIITSLNLVHLALNTAADVYDMFRQLGYDMDSPDPFEGADLDAFEFDPVDTAGIRRVYIVGGRDNHRVYLFEVDDLRTAKLRGLAWNVLQRGTALLIVTKDYRETLYIDPRFAGSATKSNVRVNKLKVISADPTRHDLDTLNAIHAHRRTGSQIYDAQAEAFNVNTVTRKFYSEYRVYYDRLCEAARKYNPGVRDFQDSDRRDKLHAFSQRLLGRLMFVYFLQRKGWIGGRAKFLTEQYRATIYRHAGENDGDTFFFYTEVLTPLFFDTFNQQRPGNITQWSGVLIPYLNGGLFDPSRDPDGPLLLPDSLFDPNSNEGILAFFNRYNFTVTEDTPLEQDVAVDPEMLGKVFENLLEERDRGQSGSFYTPRVIVAYMCQEALAGYLEDSATVSRDLVRAQFDPDNADLLSREQADAINRSLDTLTVLDPAVGSGSFLIGMMTEIIRLRRLCASALGWELTSARLADWKEAIIRDTLYGVDIKPEAIEVAQLRLWLALIVDQTLDQARPLPNLDYKLMTGNSLIETIDGEPVLGRIGESMIDSTNGSGVPIMPYQTNMLGDAVQIGMDLFDSQKAVADERIKLDALRKAFFRAKPGERKDLRARIMSQERQIVYASLHSKSEGVMAQVSALGKKSGQVGGLSRADNAKLIKITAQLERLTGLEQDLANPNKPLPFFLYRMHFHEVFTAKGGFDVVIANPPYVRQEQITAQKPELQAAYAEVYAGTADLYVYFYAQALHLLREHGELVFISPNKFFKANYGAKLRKHLAKFDVKEIIDFGELPVFASAATFPMIFSLQKSPNTRHTRFTQVKTWDDSESVHNIVKAQCQVLPNNALTGQDWMLTSSERADLLNKLRAMNTPLVEYVKGEIYRGVLTGFNTAFVIDSAKRNELIAADPRSTEIIKPFAVGDDVRKWRAKFPEKWLIATKIGVNIANFPAIFTHLSQWQTELEKRWDKGNHWWELRACAYYDIFEKPKIVYPDIAKESRFTFDVNGTFFGNTVYMLACDDLYLCGVLNSSVIWHFVKSHFASLGDPEHGGRMRFFTQDVERLPIPIPLEALRTKIGTLAEKCLAAAKDHSDRLPELELQLNQAVYQAYHLTEAEIAIVEGTINHDKIVQGERFSESQ